MPKIALDRDSEYAPCSFLICLVDESGNWSTRDDSRTVLIQTDWDFPSVAQTFGWSLRSVQRDSAAPCDHSYTDGTVQCDCGVTANEFITAASEWMLENLGTIVEDTGYFDKH